jgi:hypothetical protein
MMQWNPDSFRDGINDLLKKQSKRVIKAINDLDVLIIEVSASLVPISNADLRGLISAKSLQ